MRFRAILISLILFLPLIVVGRTGDNGTTGDKEHKGRLQKLERKIAAEPTVAVSICITSGNVSVRGWDKDEVLASSEGVAEIELMRKDNTDQSGKAGKLAVLIFDRADVHKDKGCQGFSDVALNVPKGATVHVQTRDGDVSVAEVSSAYAGTQSGDISFERVSRSIEACTLSGDISIKDSSGRVNLNSASGQLDASNIRPLETGDAFEAVSVSGDITLDQVSHAELTAKTVNGNMNLTGALAHRGRYGFRTMSGDVTLSLPDDASFKLNATISDSGEIVTDFPLTLLSTSSQAISPLPPSSPSAPPQAKPVPVQPGVVSPSPATPESAQPPSAPGPDPEGPRVVVRIAPQVKIKVAPMVMSSFASRRVNAIYGTGDANITVASFSGTLHLQKH